MALLPVWAYLWLIVSSLVMLWDGAFVLLRPLTMEGGPYAHFFEPYKLYITVDKMYGDMNAAGTRDFIIAQSWMNMIEVTFNFLAVFLCLANSPKGVILAYSVSLCTMAKTILYAFVELASGNRHTGHNSVQDWLLLYILPNYCWILVPFCIVITIFPRLQLKKAKTQ